MEKNGILTLCITLVVGVILAGSLLVPVINDAQTTVGDKITLTNESPIVLREVEPGDVLECVRTVSDGVTSDQWTLNGEPAIGPTGGEDRWNVGVMSDGLYIQVNAPTNSAIGQWYDMTSPTPNYISGGGSSGAHYGVEFGEDNIQLYREYGSDSPILVVTVPYTWAYTLCPYREGEYCAPIAGGVGLVSNPNQIILCGAYTSGELDTMYYYKDGQTYVSNSSYTMTANIDTAVHSGTTDIYDATISVAMTDGANTETYTPYRILVPYQVVGHEAGGATYSLLGAIPIIVFAGLIVGIAGAVIVRRND